MGKWSSNVVLEPIEFDGDKVVFSANRLLVDDMLVLSKYFDKDKGTIAFGSAMDVCKVAGEVLPKYITNITGMTKADNTPMTKDEFLQAAKEFYFVPLVGELFGRLVQASTVGSADAKN